MYFAFAYISYNWLSYLILIISGSFPIHFLFTLLTISCIPGKDGHCINKCTLFLYRLKNERSRELLSWEMAKTRLGGEFFSSRQSYQKARLIIDPYLFLYDFTACKAWFDNSINKYWADQKRTYISNIQQTIIFILSFENGAPKHFSSA